MADYKNYNPKNIVFTFDGFLITGFADGTFISVERSEDSFTTAVGAGGDVTRIATNNRSGVATLTLQQTAPSNLTLSDKLFLDERDGAGEGVLQIEDLNGTTLLRAENAWIMKPPTVGYGLEPEDREWQFACAEIIMTVGGALV